MIVDIALARDGFINRKPILPPPVAENSFVETLKSFLNFTQKDLQNFDGVSCSLINSYDPTNSIFIYENDTGRFLYQIQTASPSIHKNNLIWNCNCVQMQNIDELEEITNSNCNVLVKRNILAQQYKNNKLPVFKNQIKENFKTLDYYIKDFGVDANSNFLLKIKCMVDPTNSNLVSNASDGSYNFYFYIFTKNNALVTTFEMGWESGSATLSKTINLAKVISTYSPNIKSIEILPLNKETENSYVAGDLYVRIDNTDAVATELGVFEKNIGNLPTRSLVTNIFTTLMPKTLFFGGGAKVYFQTPLGVFDLKIEDYNLNDANNNGEIYIENLNEGFKISGCVSGYIQPHYLNFYTDNAGQVFIQNITTNALELRNINRETISEFKQGQIDYNAKQSQQVLATGQQVASNLSGLNILGAIGAVGQGAVGLQSNQIQYGYDLQKQQEKYSLAKSKFEDKLQTESLLASLTGKTIQGNIQIEDFLTTSTNHIKLIFETNFLLNRLNQTQVDYDYSVDFHTNKQGESYNYVESFIFNKNGVSGVDTNGNYILTNWSDCLGFLLGLEQTTSYDLPYWRDYDLNRPYCNLQYSLIFQFINIATVPQLTQTTDIYAEFSNDIILPVRVRLY